MLPLHRILPVAGRGSRGRHLCFIETDGTPHRPSGSPPPHQRGGRDPLQGFCTFNYRPGLYQPVHLQLNLLGPESERTIQRYVRATTMYNNYTSPELVQSNLMCGVHCALFRKPLLELLLSVSSRIEQHFSPKVLLFRKTDLVRVLHICSNIKLMQSDPPWAVKTKFRRSQGTLCPWGGGLLQPSPQCSTHLESSLLCSCWTTSTRVLCSCSNHIFSPAILSAGGRWRSWWLPAEQLRHPRWSPTYQTTYQDWQKL